MLSLTQPAAETNKFSRVEYFSEHSTMLSQPVVVHALNCNYVNDEEVHIKFHFT